MTPNRGMPPPPVRRFLSNYFDLLFVYVYVGVCETDAIKPAMRMHKEKWMRVESDAITVWLNAGRRRGWAEN